MESRVVGKIGTGRDELACLLVSMILVERLSLKYTCEIE